MATKLFVDCLVLSDGASLSLSLSLSLGDDCLQSQLLECQRSDAPCTPHMVAPAVSRISNIGTEGVTVHESDKQSLDQLRFGKSQPLPPCHFLSLSTSFLFPSFSLPLSLTMWGNFSSLSCPLLPSPSLPPSLPPPFPSPFPPVSDPSVSCPRRDCWGRRLRQGLRTIQAKSCSVLWTRRSPR